MICNSRITNNAEHFFLHFFCHLHIFFSHILDSLPSNKFGFLFSYFLKNLCVCACMCVFILDTILLSQWSPTFWYQRLVLWKTTVHLLLYSWVPNRTWTDTGLWPRGCRPLFYQVYMLQIFSLYLWLSFQYFLEVLQF